MAKPDDCDATGAGPRSFGVWLSPTLALMADPDRALAFNRRVVVRIEVDGRQSYGEGRILTKRPDGAKRIAVRLSNRGPVHRALRADVAPVIGEYHRTKINWDAALPRANARESEHV